MYAIIEADGRQIKVEEGQEINIDYREVAAGDTIKFDKVLAYRDDAGIKLGRPTVAAGSVTATVLGEEKGPKLTVQKFRRRKNSKRRTGHRQLFTTVKIEKIEVA